MSGFALFNQEEKIMKKKAKNEVKAAEMETKLDVEFDEVKGRNWADVSDDESEVDVVPEVALESDEETEQEEEEEEEEEEKETEEEGLAPVVKAPVKELTKKEKAALKEKEMDDFDDLLAEFGDKKATAPNDNKKADAPNGEGKAAKKKKNKVAAAATAEAEEKPAEPAAPQLTEEERQAAVEAMKKKKAAGQKKAPETAAEAAKKQREKDAKKKKDKKDKNKFAGQGK